MGKSLFSTFFDSRCRKVRNSAAGAFTADLRLAKFNYCKNATRSALAASRSIIGSFDTSFRCSSSSSFSLSSSGRFRRLSVMSRTACCD